MKAFAEAWPEEAILQQAVAKLPWGHNVRLLDLVKPPEERLWYVQQAIQNGEVDPIVWTKIRPSLDGGAG
jgi:predicted nuclease of restriction endonuclease-like (RecB) superfamily